jgi:hypothetical protein
MASTGQPSASTSGANRGIWIARSSGAGGRCALYSGKISVRKLLRPASNTTAIRSGPTSSCSRNSMRANTYSAPVGMPSLVDSRTSLRSLRDDAFISPKWARKM